MPTDKCKYIYQGRIPFKDFNHADIKDVGKRVTSRGALWGDSFIG